MQCGNLYLTREEERVLSGYAGEPLAEALKIIVKVGEALGAEKLIPISHAHASGISYENIGEAGLEWLRKFKGLKVRVFSTFNPIGFDPEKWNLFVDEDFYKKQMEIINILLSMGFQKSMTCVPYLLRSPKTGEHLAWGESSAIAYANSVLGAFTNREGGPVALAAALTGKTYYAGLHVLENRLATVEVKLPELNDIAEAGAAGLLTGEIVGDKIPLVKGLKLQHARHFLAAAAASGSLALAVIDGITPRGTYMTDIVERIEIDKKDIDSMISNVEEPFDAAFHGCPHLWGPDEIIPCSWNALPGFYNVKGEKILRGTCFVVMPLRKTGWKSIVTTSGKAYFYLKKKGFDVRLVRASELARACKSKKF